MAHTVVVAIQAVLQDVLVADVPVTFRIQLSQAGAVEFSADVPATAADLTATFAGVADGSFDGSVSSIRADGSVVGTPITFPVVVTTAPATVSTLVATGVTVTVS